MLFEIPPFEKVATFECSIQHDLYKNDQGDFVIVFNEKIIPIEYEKAQMWVMKNCPEKYDEIFEL
jgi:hypothetical protein